MGIFSVDSVKIRCEITKKDKFGISKYISQYLCMGKCLHCGNEFTSKKGARKIFCSDICRATFHQNMKLAKKVIIEQKDNLQLRRMYNDFVGKLKEAAKIKNKPVLAVQSAKEVKILPPANRYDPQALKEATNDFSNKLDGMKVNFQDEYIAMFDNCEYQNEIEIVAQRLKADKRLEEWQKRPLYDYGKKRYDKL